MRVQFDLPEHVVKSITNEARALGVTPGDIVRRDLIRRVVDVPRVEQVRAMVRAGLCDADIAQSLHVTTTNIARTRRGLGLPANPRYRKRQKAEAA